MDKKKYLLLATITLENDKISDIPCKVYLPERVTDKPYIKFVPTMEQFNKMNCSHEGDLFTAEIKGLDGKIYEEIKAPLVYLKNATTKSFGGGISEYFVDGDPQDLTVTHYYENFKHTSVKFWISPNKMLSPAISQEISDDGSIKRGHISEFTLGNGIDIHFDNNYCSKEDNQELLQWSYLVGNITTDISQYNTEKLKDILLPKIDDFLLIASLGSRTRTACLGFKEINDKIHTSYYRGKIQFPTGISEFSFNQGLVEKKDFKEFLTQCHTSFNNHPNKNVLRGAIFSLVPVRKRILEDSFLSLFSSLESIILDYRRQEELEFVIPTEMWRNLKKQLRANIKSVLKNSSTPIITSTQRDFIYGKIDELNRIPLSVAFKHFCENYQLDLSDLWPVFSSKNTIGLSDIRNWLIHGESVTPQCHNALRIARENLKWILERVILAVLGWPVERTEVSPEILKRCSYVLTEMSAQQATITQIFTSNFIDKNN